MKASPGRASSELDAALRVYRNSFISIVVFSLILNVLLTLTPALYMLQIYDRVMISHNKTTLLMLTLMLLVLYVLQGTLDFLRAVALSRIGTRLDIAMNKRVFGATFDRCLSETGASPTQGLNDLSLLRQALTGPGVMALLDAPWIPVFLGINFTFSPVLGLFALCAAGLLILLTYLSEHASRRPMASAAKLGGQSSHLVATHARNAEVIEAMGMLENVRARWLDLYRRHVLSHAQATERASILNAATKFVRIGNQSLIVGLGTLEVLEGHITSGMMIASAMLVGRALQPAEMLIVNWRNLATAHAAYKRLRSLLNRFPERPESMSLPVPVGEISLENVSAVAPETRTPILHKLSLTIPAGQTVAVIGPTASGKSTLMRLLVGVWPTEDGVVRLDGADVRQWNRAELGPHIGYLPQDVELFDGTIAENICRFGRADSARIIEAARRTGMHEAILRFSKGYDTPLGEGGSFLSGGQRQRIALARAIYGDPTLVILDEPNSNLDDVGEQALMETIRELKRRHTTVVIVTHRLNILAVADLILALADGTVRMYGPRDKVIAALSLVARRPQSTPVTADD